MAPEKVEREPSPLEVLGAQKARRAMASRITDALPYITGAIGVTVIATMQDGPGDPTTGSVPFSVYTYLSWGAAFHAQDIKDQEQIAFAHVEQSISLLQQQLETLHARSEERKRLEAEAAANVEKHGEAPPTPSFAGDDPNPDITLEKKP